MTALNAVNYILIFFKVALPCKTLWIYEKNESKLPDTRESKAEQYIGKNSHHFKTVKCGNILNKNNLKP